jgi:hypothetical protein
MRRILWAHQQGKSREASDGLSWVTSNELSRGWVISGKYLPKENSVITCDIFITEMLVKIVQP